MSKIIGCIRPAPDDPDASRQREALAALGCDPIFLNSGSRRHRYNVFEAAIAGDVLVATDMTRFASSLADLCRFFKTATERGLSIRALAEGLDTARAADARALLLVVQTLSAYDSERIRTAMSKARDIGAVHGRQSRFSPEQWPEISRELEQSRLAVVARNRGVSRQTLFNFRKRMRGY
jgi:DNA invertase Pin-like site-specific DNA recombinase